MIIDLASPDEAMALFGSQDRHLRMIRDRFGVTIVARNGAVKLSGADEDEVRAAGRVVTTLLARIRRNEQIEQDDVARAIALAGGVEVEEVVEQGPRERRSGSGERVFARGGETPPRTPPAAGAAGIVAAPGTGKAGAGNGGRHASGRLPAGGLPGGSNAGVAAAILSSAETAPARTGGTGSIEGYRARTAGQQGYLDLIEKNEIVFAIGPAGTGKTFLAVLKAVERLKAGLCEKIVLCRPAVEAGERLGFLPGDFHAKVNPYLRPLYDALNEILDVETVRKLIEREIIEIVPLAYMRGRTLNRSFIILDEAQNTSPAQMKMFLTRMGEGSRIVVTGDTTQVDLADGKLSGLIHIQRILRPSPGIAFHHLTGSDIVRHKLVWHIIQSYERAEKEEGAAAGPHPHPHAGGGAPRERER